ncbi:MAG TPA: hypothetical protein VM264_12815 [Acidimicrobiales bacterium]|nr:hypothetical protein [Acidimicrobiales bacterium]
MGRVRGGALVALLLVGGACSGGSGASPRDVLAAAPGKTLAEGTVRVAITAELSGGSSGTAFNGEGEFDLEARTGRLVLEGAGASEIRFVGEVVFVKLAQLQQRPWLRLDVEALSSRPGVDLDSLRQLQRNDPTAVLNYLSGVTDEVAEVGTETVRGDRTTRYRATLDLDKAQAESAPEVREDIRRIVRELGTSVLPTEAWIDEEGRLRRLRYTLDLAELDTNGEAPASGKVTASFELYQFGRPVDVSAPPDAEVTDIEDLIDNPGAR